MAKSKIKKSKQLPKQKNKPVARAKKLEPGALPIARSGNLGARGRRRQHLDERLNALLHRAMLLETELQQLDEDRFYRVCIFGSARIKAESPAYKQVYQLARFLSWEGIDILTGGGPGLMEAGNMGAKLGQSERKTRSLSFGLSIQLDFEPDANNHLDVKRHHYRFSSRLDDFMRLSNAVVVTPGGVGTLLELFFTWQLIQVRHITRRPLVLLDRKFWTGLIAWMKEYPLARGLISPGDLDYIPIVDTPEEAFEIISKHHSEFRARIRKKK